MKINFRWPLAILALTLFAVQYASGASLTGKVIEVNDGDELTIFNLNRPVRIRLIGIDAPEQDQAFGAAAKQHLSDLVLEKVVVVEYSGIGSHSSLIGRVLLNALDINAQMVRDGAAWFYPDLSRLNDTQREIYYQSELAARGEKRGLWQNDGAVAPWEFVKTRELAKQPVVVQPKLTEKPSRKEGATPDLNNLTMWRTGTSAVARPQSSLDEDEWVGDPERKDWRLLKPEGENFSVLVPASGLQKSKPLPVGAETVNLNFYRARVGGTLYYLTWATGPNEDGTNEEALKIALAGIYKGLNLAFQRTGVGTFECEPVSERNISFAGYAGREFDLSACPLRGVARVYTRLIGGNRQFYVGATFYNELDGNVSKFINSFKVSAPKASPKKDKAVAQ
jgi:endonuclease YncB( thermonuclease family)